MDKKTKKPVALVILDGYGQAPAGKGNAVKLAKSPNIDKWKKQFPSILMNTGGKFVGLPDGQMGNSEVGHMNIGAGRIVYQSLALINKEIKEDLLKDNKILLKAINYAKKNNSNFHIMGLCSDGGVHAHIDHIITLAKIAKDHNVNVFVHAFTDGRDVSPVSSQQSIKKLIDAKINIASISGRYYAMDRDKRWDRIQLSYDVIVNRKGENFKDIFKYIQEEYKKKVTDEFLIPAYNKNLDGQIKDNDAVLFANFRSDRAREMSHMLIGSNKKITNYDYEAKGKRLKNLFYASMREYAGIKTNILYPAKHMKHLLGEVLENHKLVQMRAAETEKYPHVTFFLDGQQEIPKKHEKRILVDSPKVATYDLKPEMSAYELTDRIIENANDVDVFIINYAQPDMVGHTGSIPAAIKACEVADQMLGRLYDKIVNKMGGVMIITADHGNSDVMLTKEGKPMTAHSLNPVLTIITDQNLIFKDKFTNPKDIKSKLADLAPTILHLLDIKIPKEMTGEVLIKD
ncbi:2,3-bisphosphoglycerate-independent phosphoglycerate mutase [Candidatus Hepatoplasma crinochetorum]|uniref:2,3-bisphosphoglycerate-independent phosphoglycerate mutase n=1 Tax=Candidatus Hepatoplasma crinochetorum TaxID=295596 RepID=UPI00308CC9AE|nr:MAG: 2,3-bisphosphoglycerate-independent phosphoglycerate mutase [Candidatus Hepatoplasma crinochetorum]